MNKKYYIGVAFSALVDPAPELIFAKPSHGCSRS